MIEQDNNQVEQESVEINKWLYRLASSDLVKEQLEVGNGKWLVKPDGLPLDIAFVERGYKEEGISFLGVKMCGKENVVGIHLKRSKNGVNLGLRLVENDSKLNEISKRGARILVMTPKDLRSWVDFYDQLKEEDLVAKLGERSLKLSGLEWLSKKGLDQTVSGLGQVLQKNQEYFETLGVEEVEFDDEGKVLFLGKGGEKKEVEIFHVRNTELDREKLVSKVSKNGEKCWGMVVQRAGETKREVEERAKVLGEELSQEMGKDGRVVAVTKDQVSLWKKMGMSSNMEAKDKESELSAEEVLRFLYLGESNVEPGILGRPPLMLSLPGKGDNFDYPEVDIVFTKKNNSGSKHVETVDNWLVFDRRGKEVSLSNVAGIRIFPRNSDFEEMKKYMDPVRKDLSHRTGLPGAYILNLTPELFERWQENRTPFLGNSESSEQVDVKKQHEYFMPSSVEKAYYFQLRQKAEIGGNKNGLLLVDGQGNKITHLFDVGLGFSDMPKGYNGIGKDPNTHDGLLRLFRQGILPMVPGWWEEEYLKQTAVKMTGLSHKDFIKSDLVAQYVLAELYKRSYSESNKDKLLEILPEETVKNIEEFGPQYSKKWWGEHERLIQTATPTHPHADHINLFAYLNSDVKMILSGPMAGFFNAITQKAGSWRKRLVDRKMITEPMIKGAYQSQGVDVEQYFYSGRPIRLSSSVSMEPHFVTHSVPATWQLYSVMSKDGGVTNLFNSGDWNVDESKKVFNVAEKLSGRPDIIVMEATNTTGEKAYLGKTEKDVRDTFHNLLSNSEKELVVVVAPINNLTRLKNLMEVTEESGRKMAMSFSHSELMMQLKAAQKLAPADAEGFDDLIPYDLGKDNLTVWAKQMTAPRKFHKALIELSDRGNLGSLTHERLSRENGDWVVVVSPYDILEDQFDGLNIDQGMKVVWMSSFPHEAEQKNFVGANYGWMRKSNKIKFISDLDIRGQGGWVKSKLSEMGVLHVSGHATMEEMIAITDILAGSDRKNVPVIINHSENPGVAAEELVRRLGDKVKPISKLRRYDVSNPFEHPGFYYPL